MDRKRKGRRTGRRGRDGQEMEWLEWNGKVVATVENRGAERLTERREK